MPPTFAASVRQVEPVTPRSRLVTLDLGGHAFAFEAGQAVLAAPAGQPGRPYSIACSPERAAAIGGVELLVGVGAPDAPAPLACARPGDEAEVNGPLGDFRFVTAPGVSHLLFIAGGTGIAPLRSMLDHAQRHHPDLRMAVMYSARQPDEFAFLPELRALEAAGALELHQTVTRGDEAWEGPRGRIGRAHFEAVLHDPASTLGFVCGPPGMVAEAVTTLVALGIPDRAIRREEWGKKT